jgi:hypothetical protein
LCRCDRGRQYAGEYECGMHSQLVLSQNHLAATGHPIEIQGAKFG